MGERACEHPILPLVTEAQNLNAFTNVCSVEVGSFVVFICLVFILFSQFFISPQDSCFEVKCSSF